MFRVACLKLIAVFICLFVFDGFLYGSGSKKGANQVVKIACLQLTALLVCLFVFDGFLMRRYSKKGANQVVRVACLQLTAALKCDLFTLLASSAFSTVEINK